MRTAFRSLIIVGTIGLGACAPDAPHERCDPGAVTECGCVGGGSGTQTCGDDGILAACTGCPTHTNDPAPATCGPGIYPCGPYGYAAGTIIENLEFVGKRDDNASGFTEATDQAIVMQLSDVVADPAIQVLMIDICPVWCGPCNLDQPGLVQMYNDYKPGGHVEFYAVLPQDVVPGNPADLQDLDRWGGRYRLPYPIGIDPTQKTNPYNPIAAYPAHVVIRTRDMKIAWVGNGVDQPTVKAQIDAVLASP
jgi:hypothetical protein